MELGTIKERFFNWTGWLSIVIGLTLLAILNIILLWGYNLPIGKNIALWLLATLILGIISIFNKSSRRLGLWGLGLGLYLGFFFVAMFMFSWAANPFP